MKPKYYTELSPEPIDVILNWNLNFLEGNVLKYLARYKQKNGVEDLKKARYYLDRLILQLEEEQKLKEVENAEEIFVDK